MGIVRNIDEYIKFELAKRGAAVTASDTLEVVRHGPIAEINPDLSVAWANYCLEWRVREYTGYSCILRRDLTEFWTELHKRSYGRALVVKSPVVRTTHDILKDINDFTLLDLTEADVVDAPIVDGKYTEITITLTNNNLWFTGSLTLPLQLPMLIANGKQIVSLPLDHRLRVVDDPLANSSRYNGNLLTYGHTFVGKLFSRGGSNTYDIDNSLISSTEANDIIAALKTVGIQAVYDSAKNNPGFNLYNAKVLYSGPSEGYVDNHNLSGFGKIKNRGFGPLHGSLKKARTDVEYVTVISVDSEYCASLNCEPIFIHFNINPDYKRVTINRPPIHYWPLTADRANRGLSNLRFNPSGEVTVISRNGEVGFVNKGLLSGLAYTTGLGFDIDLAKDFTFSFDISLASTQSYGSYPSDVMDLFNYLKPNDPKFTIKTPLTADFYGPSVTSHFVLTNQPQGSPHWLTVALIKRGADLLIYLNGQLYRICFGISTGVFNALKFYGPSGHIAAFRDIRYFDYALDARQVIEASLGRMDSPYVPPAKKDLPMPLHYWPLDGDVNNLGTSGVPLSKIFRYVEYTDYNIPNKDTKKFALLASTANANFGVDLDITKDFTLAFDLWINKDKPSSSGIVSIFSNEKGAESGKFSSISCDRGPYVSGGPVDPENDQNTSNNMTAYSISNIIRYHFVRMGDKISVYGNGEYLWSCIFAPPTFSCLNTYAKPGNSYVATRNWAYYDCALDDAQVMAETEFSFKLSKRS